MKMIISYVNVRIITYFSNVKLDHCMLKLISHMKLLLLWTWNMIICEIFLRKGLTVHYFEIFPLPRIVNLK